MPEKLSDVLEPEALEVVEGSPVLPQPNGWKLVGLFSFTLFLSALLLFSIQPIFAKMLLPLLGGAPAVWNTAMLFYQAALLAGYAYAHFSSHRLSPKAHLLSHLALLAIPLAVLPFAVPKGSEPTGGANPVPWLLLTMLVAIGPPFFVVSTTGPLLQRWFSRTGHPAAKDPYFLYAASNLGSMLGLLGYPFLIEPNLRLTEQSHVWKYGYIGLVLCIAACALVLWKSDWIRDGSFEKANAFEESSESAIRNPQSEISWPRRLRWIALAMVPSSLMLGVTQYISTDVAAVPLLWVIPLSLYLLTFTIVFARRPIIPHKLTLILMPVTLGGLVCLMALNVNKPLLLVVGAHLCAFFFVAMLCHGEMAKDRPPVRHLTEFYVWMSVGGVLGGIFNALVAPSIFPIVLEYPLALVAAAALYPGAWKSERKWTLGWDIVVPAATLFGVCGALWLERNYGLTSSTQAKTMIIIAGVLTCLLYLKRPLRFALSLAGMLCLGIYLFYEHRGVFYVERSFFGVTRIENSYKGRYYELFHGTTLHGMQGKSGDLRRRPVSYYFPSGPIGTVLTYMNRPANGSFAVVGLGSGTLASYGRAGENWTYYEIDPVVERVARNPKYFSYLSDSPAKVKVVLGDARVSLKGSDETYDLLMLDAYSSDAVPIHLVTKEAVEIYAAHMKPDGIIAFHISNKHLDLAPVIHEICKALGWESRQFTDTGITLEERALRKTASDWIIAYRPGTDVEAILAHGDWRPTRGKPGVGLWTDDFSSIWSIYKRS